MNTKILAAYFSHSGNTRYIAEQIQKTIGGDLFEIKTVKPYSNDYDTVVKQAKQEHDNGVKPDLAAKVGNIGDYDLIILGYPMWWYTIPAAVFTFLSQYDLSGKVIAPFCTHEGSGLSKSVDDIKKLCTRSKVLDGIAIRGSSVKTAQNTLSDWLKRID